MIKKLYECGCFDYKKFILSHQKELLLSTTTANILILIMEEYMIDKYFSISSIKDKLIISDEEFDDAITKLMERNYYSINLQFENGIGRESISLDGFFNYAKDILEDKDPLDMENELFQVTQYIQKEFNKVLTADELDIVSSLLIDDKYTVDEIKDATKYMKENYKNASIKNLVSSLSRFREEAKAKKELPSYVKDFLKNIK